MLKGIFLILFYICCFALMKRVDIDGIELLLIIGLVLSSSIYTMLIVEGK